MNIWTRVSKQKVRMVARRYADPRDTSFRSDDLALSWCVDPSVSLTALLWFIQNGR